MVASRALRPIALVLAAFAAGGAAAASPALVVDADSGKVLHAERATDPWFPASITKLMTAYVALSAVREGKLSMDSSAHRVRERRTRSRPPRWPSGPAPQITLDNALKIIMVKSANDVSTTIAEELGGSVEGFAGMMNAAARRLGMNESYFVNPHGLPDDRQQTSSARDMAILGRALILREFPEHGGPVPYERDPVGRRVMRNHNGLIGRYPGADGMKTGFICSSGFNVVASATRDGRRLITVVMGSPSANERTIKAAELFDRGFSTASLSVRPARSRRCRVLDACAAARHAPVICDRRGPMPARRTRPAPCRRTRPAAPEPVCGSGFSRPSPAAAASLGPRTSSVRARRVSRSASGSAPEPAGPTRAAGEAAGRGRRGPRRLAAKGRPQARAAKAAEAPSPRRRRRSGHGSAAANRYAGSRVRSDALAKPAPKAAREGKPRRPRPMQAAAKISPDPKRTPAKPRSSRPEATAKPAPKAN